VALLETPSTLGEQVVEEKGISAQVAVVPLDTLVTVAMVGGLRQPQPPALEAAVGAADTAMQQFAAVLVVVGSDCLVPGRTVQQEQAEPLILEVALDQTELLGQIQLLTLDRLVGPMAAGVVAETTMVFLVALVLSEQSESFGVQIAHTQVMQEMFDVVP